MASCRACLWSTYCARPWWRPWQTLLYTHSAHHLLRVIAMNQTDTQINRISSLWEAPWRKGAPKVVPWGWGSGELLWGSLFIAGAAKTKCHRPGGLTQQKLISSQVWGQAPGLWLLLRPLPGLQAAVFSPCRTQPLLRASRVLIFSSSKDTSRIGLGPTLMTSFDLITSFKTLSPNTVIVWGTEVKTSTQETAVRGEGMGGTQNGL